MKRSRIVAVISVISLFIAAEVVAQRGMGWRGSGGWGPSAKYGRMYDPGTVTSISGKVMHIEQFTPMGGMRSGVHVTVKTDKETVSVHLGPAWYLENQDIKIEPGDKVGVKGSRITFSGKPAMIAAEIKKGDHILKLRDDNGIPAWSGWRRR
jgi:hypothetical protein